MAFQKSSILKSIFGFFFSEFLDFSRILPLPMRLQIVRGFVKPFSVTGQFLQSHADKVFDGVWGGIAQRFKDLTVHPPKALPIAALCRRWKG
jgi:hypothetical protein